MEISVRRVSSGAHAGVHAGHTEQRLACVDYRGEPAAWLIRETVPGSCPLYFVAPYRAQLSAQQLDAAGIWREDDRRAEHDSPAWRAMLDSGMSRELALEVAMSLMEEA